MLHSITVLPCIHTEQTKIQKLKLKLADSQSEITEGFAIKMKLQLQRTRTRTTTTARYEKNYAVLNSQLEILEYFR